MIARGARDDRDAGRSAHRRRRSAPAGRRSATPGVAGRHAGHRPPGQVPRRGRAGDRASAPRCRRTSPTSSTGPSARDRLPNDLAAVQAFVARRRPPLGRRTDVASVAIVTASGSHRTVARSPAARGDRTPPSAILIRWRRGRHSAGGGAAGRRRSSPRHPSASPATPQHLGKLIRKAGRPWPRRPSNSRCSNRKDSEQLIAIAQALGIKATRRAEEGRRSSIKILEPTGARCRRDAGRRTASARERRRRAVGAAPAQTPLGDADGDAASPARRRGRRAAPATSTGTAPPADGDRPRRRRRRSCSVPTASRSPTGRSS